MKQGFLTGTLPNSQISSRQRAGQFVIYRDFESISMYFFLLANMYQTAELLNGNGPKSIQCCYVYNPPNGRESQFTKWGQGVGIGATESWTKNFFGRQLIGLCVCLDQFEWWPFLFIFLKAGLFHFWPQEQQKLRTQFWGQFILLLCVCGKVWQVTIPYNCSTFVLKSC